MNILAALAASAAGIVAIAVAMVVSMHYTHLPSGLHPWIARLIIVIMYCGGSVIVAAGLGSVVSGLIADAVDLIGGQYAGLINVGIIIFALVMLVGLVAELIWAPSTDVAITAACIPLLLSLVAGGFIHQFYLDTTAPGQQIAAQIMAWVAG